MAQALVPYVHHERQEQGSMLCAQHCLNTLLQRQVYDAAQLAEIATLLDSLEAEQLDDEEFARRETSALNMDDSGFFSVGVMESALQTWSLKMVRWNSAEMAPYHTNPETTQLAFVLNFESHWFTIRSFGQNAKYWFNLNSFFKQPQYIGPFYLSELLRQSTAEGYSVFAIQPAEGSIGPASFYVSEADEIADTIPPELSSIDADSASSSAGGLHPLATSAIDLTGDDSEDVELQAALKASLEDAQRYSAEASSAGPGSTSNGLDQARRQSSSEQPSSARHARVSTPTASGSSPHTPANRAALPEASGGRRRKSRKGDVEESEEVRQALEASAAEGSVARLADPRAARGSTLRNAISLDDDNDDEMEDSFGAVASGSRRSPFLHPAVRGTVEGENDDDIEAVDLAGDHNVDARDVVDMTEDDFSVDPFSIQGAPEASSLIGPRQDRHYDDEDEALQAALAASMGDTSVLERLQKRKAASPALQPRGSAELDAPALPEDVGRIARMREEARRKEREDAIAASGSGKATEGGEVNQSEEANDEAQEEEQEEQVSPEEIRRRRLARFGA